jgi:hypothetical protein
MKIALAHNWRLFTISVVRSTAISYMITIITDIMNALGYLFFYSFPPYPALGSFVAGFAFRLSFLTRTTFSVFKFILMFVFLIFPYAFVVVVQDLISTSLHDLGGNGDLLPSSEAYCLISGRFGRLFPVNCLSFPRAQDVVHFFQV